MVCDSLIKAVVGAVGSDWLICIAKVCSQAGRLLSLGTNIPSPGLKGTKMSKHCKLQKIKNLTNQVPYMFVLTV